MPPAYEILLLNTAVPQIQAAQSGDTYVVPRDIAFSAALTLSAGTANGVPYLNTSKVLTTGSALTYNGTGLGVGISSAGYLVDISTPLTGTTVGSNVALNLESQASGRDVEIRMGDTVNSSGRFGYLSGSLYWAFGSTEQMRLTSTGLGIGTSSPGTALHVQRSSANAVFRLASSGGSGRDWSIASETNGYLTIGSDLLAGQLNLYQGNVKIGGTAVRATTQGTNQLVLFNGTAPVGTLANGVSFYSASGEARVMDAAGNSTLLSPHDTATNEWIFHSKHTPTGKVLRIDVERLLKFVNDHFGLDAVHEFIED